MEKKKVYFRFYGQLNDFFDQQVKVREYCFQGRQTVKDCIESMGVPHTEIYLILKRIETGNKIVDFDMIVTEKDNFSLFPKFNSLEIPQNMLIRTSFKIKYQNQIKFVLDIHLGKLASYLRMLGFDTFYRNDYSDPELAKISSEENRILLTRDHGLLKRKKVVYGFFIRDDDPREQLISVLKYYQLFDKINPMGRCMECNSILKNVDKEKIIDKLEPKTKKYFNTFFICPDCNKIYWKGSHYKHMNQFIKKLKSNFSNL